jgi:DNA-binding CsgD family transcriptional regulator
MHLTPRQLEVLALLCEGLPNKLICRQLNISTGTVKVHMSCILRELGVASRLQAVVAARRLGLVDKLDAGIPEQTATGLAMQPARSAGRPVFGLGSRDAVAF